MKMLTARTAAFLALLIPQSALALPWYVDSEDDATALRTALSELWADAPIDVLVGELPASTDGLTRAEENLVLVANGKVYERPGAADTLTEVTLARSWLDEVRLADSGWVPDVDLLPSDVLGGEGVGGSGDEVVINPPPPPIDPPLRRYRFGVALGAREAFTEPGFVDGGRVATRVQAGDFGVELGGYFGGLSRTRVSAAEKAILESIPDGFFSSDSDRWSLTLAADWHPGRFGAAAPRLLAGTELYRWDERRIVPGGLVDSQRWDRRVGIVFGAGLDVQLNEELTLRSTWYDRVSLDRYGLGTDPEWIEQFIFAIDLVLTL